MAKLAIFPDINNVLHIYFALVDVNKLVVTITFNKFFSYICLP